MSNRKMYLTEAEAKTMNLPSVQEQIDRHNAAVRASRLETLTASLYGAGLCIFDPTPILWAAERLADTVGVAEAKDQLRKANRLREKHGVPPAVFPYGHRLF